MSTEMQLKLGIEKAFSKIGTSNGTKCEGSDNLDPILHEGFVAQHLAHIAGKRWEAFKAAIEKEGIEDGATSDSYTMVVKTNQPTEVLDAAEYDKQLMAAGVSIDVLRTARKRAMKQRKGARRITIGVL